MKNRQPVRIFSRALTWFRRLRTVRFIIRILTFLALFLETGVFLLVISALFLVVMPAAVLLFFAVYAAALTRRRKSNREMAARLLGRRVFVFYPPRGTDFSERSFFGGLCGRLVGDADSAVLVVSPYFVSSEGFGRGGYLTCRDEGGGIFICRRYSFFSLRRAVLSKLETVNIY